jgi:hypothetical protein
MIMNELEKDMEGGDRGTEENHDVCPAGQAS